MNNAPKRPSETASYQESPWQRARAALEQLSDELLEAIPHMVKSIQHERQEAFWKRQDNGYWHTIIMRCDHQQTTLIPIDDQARLSKVYEDMQRNLCLDCTVQRLGLEFNASWQAHDIMVGTIKQLCYAEGIRLTLLNRLLGHVGNHTYSSSQKELMRENLELLLDIVTSGFWIELRRSELIVFLSDIRKLEEVCPDVARQQQISATRLEMKRERQALATSRSA